MTSNQELFKTAKIAKGGEAKLQRAIDRLTDAQHLPVYKLLSAKTSIPWQLIAAIHYREASGDLTCRLKDGEPLGSTSQFVPTAVEELSKYDKPTNENWTSGECLDFAETYNGLGYKKRGIRSPYVWAATTMQQPGKYIRDGEFSTTTWDTQPGIAAIFLAWQAANQLELKDIEKVAQTVPAAQPQNASLETAAKMLDEAAQFLKMISFLLPPQLRTAANIFLALEPEISGALGHIANEGLNTFKFADLLEQVAKASTDASQVLKQ